MIDPESIVCTYEGHTIFSIFQNWIKVFEQIRDQLLKNEELTNTDDKEGPDHEIAYLRRLYRTVNLPIGDIQ